MLTQEVIAKLKQNMDADGLFTVPASVPDFNPEIIMPKGLTWEEKHKWALESFEKCLSKNRAARENFIKSLRTE